MTPQTDAAHIDRVLAEWCRDDLTVGTEFGGRIYTSTPESGAPAEKWARLETVGTGATLEQLNPVAEAGAGIVFDSAVVQCSIWAASKSEAIEAANLLRRRLTHVPLAGPGPGGEVLAVSIGAARYDVDVEATPHRPRAIFDATATTQPKN